MEYKLPQLPYELDALSPHLTKETDRKSVV